VTVITPRLLEVKLGDSCSEDYLPFTNTLGQSIASDSRPNVEGSLGIFLKQNNANKYFALTCRHCYFSEEESLAFSVGNKSQPRRYVMQPGSGTFEQCRQENSSYINFWSSQKKKEPAMASQQLEALEKMQHLLNSFDRWESRVIGFVSFSPPHVLHVNGWLKDWALIELDLKQFGEKPLENIVYIGISPKMWNEQSMSCRIYFFLK
jgi:hypothetical protein